MAEIVAQSIMGSDVKLLLCPLYIFLMLSSVEKYFSYLLVEVNLTSVKLITMIPHWKIWKEEKCNFKTVC